MIALSLCASSQSSNGTIKRKLGNYKIHKASPRNKSGRTLKNATNKAKNSSVAATKTQGKSAKLKEKSDNGLGHEKTISNRVDRNTIYNDVDQMPTFPGGVYALMNYLSSNIQYPYRAQELGVQGRVVVSFVVEIDGSISDFQVVQSVFPDLDNEALRVVRAMPRWTPGRVNGEKVRVKYNVPISFILN